MKLGPVKILDRYEVPSFDDPGTLYLCRWRLFECPWFGMLLHRFDSPDSRPTLHDHPWSFVSIILRGGYVEVRQGKHNRNLISTRRIRFINVMRRDDAHYIERLDRTPTWSLLFIGKRRRTWGYIRPVSGSGRGAWYWTPFDRDRHAEEFEAALQARAAGR